MVTSVLEQWQTIVPSIVLGISATFVLYYLTIITKYFRPLFFGLFLFSIVTMCFTFFDLLRVYNISAESYGDTQDKLIFIQQYFLFFIPVILLYFIGYFSSINKKLQDIQKLSFKIVTFIVLILILVSLFIPYNVMTITFKNGIWTYSTHWIQYCLKLIITVVFIYGTVVTFVWLLTHQKEFIFNFLGFFLGSIVMIFSIVRTFLPETFMSPLQGVQFSPAIIPFITFIIFESFGTSLFFIRKVNFGEMENQKNITRQKELILQVSTDTLTGLRNRNSFYIHLSKSINESAISSDKDEIGLLFIDLDNLSHINNFYGHGAGDDVIKMAAERIQHQLRSSDKLFRLGGDEFAVVLHDISDTSVAGLVSNKLIKDFSKTPFNLEEWESGRSLYVGISVGISCFPMDSQEPQELIHHADVALLEAKKLRNSFKYYANSMSNISDHNVNIADLLRRTIQNETFIINYQPLTDSFGITKGAEALIRLSGEYSNLSPEVFIPVAEATGMIKEIGYWVIEKVFKDRKSIESVVNDSFFISINLSAKQVGDPELISYIEKRLELYGVKATWFSFEITESALMENFEDFLPIIKALQKRGFKIVLDDFGTGYSSLGYLRDIPVDCLKVDKTFLLDLPNDKKNGAIIKSIFHLAEGLMLDVVVEGIETQQQHDYLSDFNYTHLQGYYFSRPLAFEDLIEYVKING